MEGKSIFHIIITFFNIDFEDLNNWEKKILIMERKQSIGFLRIFTVAFLLFLTPAGGYNPNRPIS